MSHSGSEHRVVIVGGGFGGLHAARALRRVAVEVTLVDRRNFHLFQPLLYQVATGGLSPANIAAPIRAILRRQHNVRVLLGDAVGLDAGSRRLLLADGELEYDTLVLATGVSHHYFGHPEWASLAPGLKTVEDATEIRRRVLLAFERAERATSPEDVAAWLSFVVVGGGPTGVELAGALAEIARVTMRDDFRAIDPRSARIVLVEGVGRVLPSYPERLSAAAARSLQELGVEVRTRTLVTDLGPEHVLLRSADATEKMATRTVLWAAGIQASPLARAVAAATGAPQDRAGRVLVEPDCSVPGYPEILVAGDMAASTDRGGTTLPGVAQVAMQQGGYIARLIAARLDGRTLPPFHYRDWGNMATIGRHAAVAEIVGLQFWGYLAWLAWLFVHLMKLVAFQNRLLVFVQWAWSYFSHNRAARLITGSRGAPRTEG
ncbi:MAG TPA: NAD(P)/FAD-dependent oxidoreductase [Thermoanaerobaculaceae bacterium]|nr:NAD(P)/FAD-dependent oxidoreductase [Thermoanaerobaculaceae bacterium]